MGFNKFRNEINIINTFMPFSGGIKHNQPPFLECLGGLSFGGEFKIWVYFFLSLAARPLLPGCLNLLGQSLQIAHLGLHRSDICSQFGVLRFQLLHFLFHLLSFRPLFLPVSGGCHSVQLLFSLNSSWFCLAGHALPAAAGA
jgi:hypothetical protein